VGPRASLDRYGKSRPHRDSIPGGIHVGVFFFTLDSISALHWILLVLYTTRNFKLYRSCGNNDATH